jgi:hypothetical protein
MMSCIAVHRQGVSLQPEKLHNGQYDGPKTASRISKDGSDIMPLQLLR